MEFDSLKKQIKSVDLDTLRNDEDEYFEAVIRKSNLSNVLKVLEANFGAAAWPSSTKLSKSAETIINNFGGIRKGQTLYFSQGQERAIFAMLWPWQDDERVTIKMGKG